MCIKGQVHLPSWSPSRNNDETSKLEESAQSVGASSASQSFHSIGNSSPRGGAEGFTSQHVNGSGVQANACDRTYTDYGQLDKLAKLGLTSRFFSCTFPNLLYCLLENATDESYDDIISWQPHGRAFIIQDQRRFLETVMPRFFRQTR
jgi:hypothetical protein